MIWAALQHSRMFLPTTRQLCSDRLVSSSATTWYESKQNDSTSSFRLLIQRNFIYRRASSSYGPLPASARAKWWLDYRFMVGDGCWTTHRTRISDHPPAATFRPASIPSSRECGPTMKSVWKSRMKERITSSTPISRLLSHTLTPGGSATMTSRRLERRWVCLVPMR